MVDFKEKGHNIDLSNIIIHKINKNAGDKTSTLKLANKELKIDKAEKKFISDVRESFNKKSTPTHGIFDEEDKLNGFQIALNKYLDAKSTFLDFTIEAMNFYKRTIESSAPASGGFIIFSDFVVTDNGDRYILILSINNKQGYNLSEASLAIEEILNLELNKMDLASIINISRFEKYNETENSNIKTYLTFIRGIKKISDYFQNFIGCHDKTTASESSSNLINTMNKYFEEKGYTKDRSSKLNSEILEYCQSRNKQHKDILIRDISAIINPGDLEDFLFYATNERFGNNEVVKYDSKILRSLLYIEYSSPEFKIKFNKNKIGKDIRINKEKNSITLLNLPSELLNQIK